jgi:excisionase family DNA binding protein
MADNLDRSSNARSEDLFDHQVEAAQRNRELITELTRWRTEHGPNQREVAQRMHTSQPAITRLESHRHDAQLSTLARYVASIGLRLDFVLSDAQSGSVVWSSDKPDEDLPRENLPEPGALAWQSPKTPSGPRSDLLIIEGPWSKLRTSSLKPELHIVAEADTAGWKLLYDTSPRSPISLDRITAIADRIEAGDDPHVHGIFTSQDSDPVAIFTISDAEANEGQVHTLIGKMKGGGVDTPSAEALNFVYSLGALRGLVEQASTSLRADKGNGTGQSWLEVPMSFPGLDVKLNVPLDSELHSDAALLSDDLANTPKVASARPVVHKRPSSAAFSTGRSGPMLTEAQVARMFRVDPKTVNRWAKAGRLTSIRTVGGHRRYPEAEVRALLEKKLRGVRTRKT